MPFEAHAVVARQEFSTNDFSTAIGNPSAPEDSLRIQRLMSSVCVVLLLSGPNAEASPEGRLFQWVSFADPPNLPAGACAFGLAGEVVLVGGLSSPTTGMLGYGPLRISASAWVYPNADERWSREELLPLALAWSGAGAEEEGAVLVGGFDGKRVRDVVFLIHLRDGEIGIKSLPPLPEPRMLSGAALMDGRVYVAGGARSASGLDAARSFWRLDLRNSTREWVELESWPGAQRLLPAVVNQGGRLFVLGGIAVQNRGSGPARVEPLSDGYVYAPGAGWSRVADVPSPVLAGLALPFGTQGILVVSPPELVLPLEGLRPIPLSKSPFPQVWHYDTVTDTWTRVDSLPAGFVPAHAASFPGGIVCLGWWSEEGRRVPAAMKGDLLPPPHGFGILDYGALIVYFVALVLLGVRFARRERSTRDFFLAGHRIPWWAAGLSIFGTQLSAITYMAVPAKSFATDWTFYLSPLCILLVAPFLVRYYLPLFRDLNVTTAYEYLEYRFGLAMRMFGSAVFVLFQLGRIAIVLFLPALALSTVTGINVFTSILLMGLISIVYTVLGGIEAVIWSDVIQVVVLLGGALLSLGLVFLQVDGGVAGLLEVASANGKFHMFNWTWDATVASVWVILVGNFFSQLGPYTTDQAVIQRYLTTPDRKQAEKSIWLNAFMSLPSSGLFFLLGTALYVFYKQHPSALPPGLSTDAIFPWFIVQQLPAGISGILVAGLFAASMSSLDSSMNSIATVAVTDYYRRFRRTVDEKVALRLARIVTLAVGVFGTGTAIVMASFRISSLWDVFLRLLSFMGGALAGVFVLAVFTRRANGRGSLIGAFVSVALLVWVQSSTRIHFFLYAAIGSVGCIVVGYLASLLLPVSPAAEEAA